MKNLETLCLWVSQGLPLPHACSMIYMEFPELRSWRRDDPAVDLAIERAEALATKTHTDIIEHAAKEGIWQASAWWLERRRPQWFGKTQTIVVQMGAAIDQARELARDAGVDPDLAEQEVRALLTEGTR